MTKHPFDEGLALTGARVRELLTEAPGTIARYTSHLTGANGKQIRARALLACAMDGEDLVNGDSIHLAASIELFHLATLVHDDVIDDADTRRGLPTLHKQYGKRTAVICGDYLLSLSLREAALIENTEKKEDRMLLDYIHRVCAGELMQHENNGNLDLSMLTYLRIIRGKTATLFEAAYRAGAFCAGAGDALIERFAKLGRFTGMIFQLSDDCIDYESSADDAMKPVAKDFREGVVTLPLIAVVAKDPAAKDTLTALRDKPADLIAYVRNSGGTAYTRIISGRYLDKAAGILKDLPGTPSKIGALREILDLAYAGSARQGKQ